MLILPKDLSLCGEVIRNLFCEVSILQPDNSKAEKTGARCDGITSSSTIVEPVTAAADINVAATILSGIIE